MSNHLLRTHCCYVPPGAWTDADVQRASELYLEGWPTVRIARKLGRSQTALYQALAASGLTVRELRSDPYATVRSAHAVAVLFGVWPQAVQRWLRKGWITARRNKSTSHSLLLITDDALLAFVETRDYWPYWSAERMTDPDWRDTALDARERAGGRWLRAVEVQARFSISAAGLMRWVQAGKFPAGSYVYHSRPLGYFFWSTDIDLLARTWKTK